MVRFSFKYHCKFFIVIILLILTNCKFQEPNKNHGIVFLENRSKQLVIKTSNKNDIIKLIGQPHTKSINDDEEWIYFERVLSKGEYHNLGKTVLKANNILVLKFDKYGILTEKTFLNKNDIKKLEFSNNETENNLSQKSFVSTFLQSIKQKMYRRKK
tara:strand:+ start:351 stop:821 length:471 start_codon:yes stop_codon:yes gene_type:complete